MYTPRAAITFMAALALAVLMACPTALHAQTVLYNNGPLITHTGVCSGDDDSRLQNISLGMSTFGFGHSVSTGFRMADDFTVPSGGWDIDSITFYAYQTGAPTSPSPITGLYLQIWDGPPDDPGSSIVWGDLTTNILSDTSYSGIRRSLDTGECATNRYIFANTADVVVSLGAGTYWLDWMTDGSLASGPWAPPVTILGETTTGNALQYTSTGWNETMDTGSNTQQDMPFIIRGRSTQGVRILDTGDPDERACNPRSYTDLGNGIVRDNTTGLEWMQLTAPGAYTWAEAAAYVMEVNDNETLGLGYDDWRLPTIEELSSLVDAGRWNPPLDPLFNDPNPIYCWSSDVFARNSSRAWRVGFGGGRVSSAIDQQFSVRLVRGGQYGPFGDFLDNADGTITDQVTGLMWQRCGFDQTWDGDNCIGSAATLTRDQAFDYVQELNDYNTQGYDDWRLPTRNELQTLLDYTSFEPATQFPDTVDSRYWTSTVFARPGTLAWYVNFNTGVVNVDNETESNYVRAVRDGLCRTAQDWCIDESDCEDDGLYCTGDPVCDDGFCGFTGNPCEEGSPFCDEAGNTCVECLSSADCEDDGLFCTGDPVCDNGMCGYTGDPCEEGAPFCDEDNGRCLECLEAGDCDDDGLYCTGDPVCDDGFCDVTGDPCGEGLPACDEDNDRCVECVSSADCEGELAVCDEAVNACVQCLADGDCAETEVCRDNVCLPGCELIVTHRRIRSDKLSKPRRVVLNVTSADEIFDIYGQIDIEPLVWDRVKFSQKKNRMRIRAVVPFMLAPGVYPISVGDCFGEVVVE